MIKDTKLNKAALAVINTYGFGFTNLDDLKDSLDTNTLSNKDVVLALDISHGEIATIKEKFSKGFSAEGNVVFDSENWTYVSREEEFNPSTIEGIDKRIDYLAKSIINLRDKVISRNQEVAYARKTHNDDEVYDQLEDSIPGLMGEIKTRQQNIKFLQGKKLLLQQAKEEEEEATR